MGWLIQVYLLEEIFVISILKHIRFGFLFIKKTSTYGIFFGIWKFDIKLIVNIMKMRNITLDKYRNANA